MLFKLHVTEDTFEIHVGIDATIIVLLLNLLGFVAPYLVHLTRWM